MLGERICYFSIFSTEKVLYNLCHDETKHMKQKMEEKYSKALRQFIKFCYFSRLCDVC